MNRKHRRAARRKGITLVCGSDGPWKDDDTTWFASNPDRSHRIRRSYRGEFPGVDVLPGPEDFTVVRQLDAGLRIRTAVQLQEDLLPVPDIDDFLACIFDAVAEQRGGGPVATSRRIAEMYWARTANLSAANH